MGERPIFYDGTVQRPGKRAEAPTISDYDRKRADVYNTLEKGIQAITEGDNFKAWLSFGSRFHHYSWGNQMLIHAQRPDASQVAGYGKWKELGRQVKRGEKGISIMVPHTRRIQDEETGTETTFVSSFGVGWVFDVAQTDGPPVPEPPQPKELKGNDPIGDELFSRISNFLVDDMGVSHRRDFLHGHARGTWNPTNRIVTLKKGLYADQEVKTFMHEAIHAFCNHKGDTGREDAEAVTEASTFVTLNAFGMDTSKYSFPYVAGWSQDKPRIVTNLQEIQRVSHYMIEKISKGGR
jgi:hypothetical protein